MKSRVIHILAGWFFALTFMLGPPAGAEDSGALFPAPFWNPDGTYAGYGFVNSSGRQLIPGRFASARPFSEGLARVMDNDHKYGYIDKNGRLVIPCKYKFAGDFHEGVAVATIEDKSGYINKSGRELFPFDNVNPWTFSDGLGCVSHYLPGEIWWVDKYGRTMISRAFGACAPFHEGLALLFVGSGTGILSNPTGRGYQMSSAESGSIGAMDKSGNVVFTIKKQVGAYRPFSEGLALVQAMTDAGMRFGFIDKTGEFTVQPQYLDAHPFSEGLAAVSVGNPQGGAVNWGYIDKTGAMKIPDKFHTAESFHEGLASVVAAESSAYSFIDKTGKILFTLEDAVPAVDYEDKFDYKTGDRRSGFFFKDGLCKVRLKSGKIEYLDKNGKKTWESEKPDYY